MVMFCVVVPSVMVITSPTATKAPLKAAQIGRAHV
jgi:hypothetical protein